MEPWEANGWSLKAAGQAPDEAFPCPACGQMLAPSCRVCVACQTPIDFAQVRKVEPEVPIAQEEAPPEPPVEPARFSWGIFFAVFFLWLLGAIVTTQLLGPSGSQVALGSFVLASSLWVFVDAQKQGVPKPLRWGMGALLLWILVFPWYLSRRRTPQASCLFIEAEAGPIARTLLVILMIFFLVGALLLIFNEPPPK